MSKKHKALKQLIRAQMQANASAVAQKKDLPGQILSNIQPTPMASTITSAPVFAAQPAIIAKQNDEFVLIKKDIRLSILLISAVIVCLLIIYFIDRSNPFLLNLANQIFKLISK